jgi:SPP1 gp7 family putative phage head morphogenesis protein
MQTRAHGPREVTFPSDSFLTELAKHQAAEGALPSLYGYHPATRAAMRAIARNIAAVALDVWTGPFGRARRAATGAGADELRALLRRPCPIYGGRDAVKLQCIYSTLDGEANIVLRDAAFAPVTGADTKPLFFTVHAKRDVVLDRSRGVPVWTAEGQRLPYGSLVRVTDPDPDDPWRGDGCRRALQVLGETDWYIRTYLKSFFANGADPGGMLVSQLGMSKKQVENLLKEWEDRHGGPRRTNRPTVLHGGVRYEVPTQRHVDMELRATLTQQRDDALMVLGVPESEVAITSQQTYSNGLTANAGFWVQTLLPTMMDIEEAWNDPVLGVARRFGQGLYIGFDLAVVREVLKNVASKVAAFSQGVQSGIPANVLIEFLGMDIDPIEGGDEPLVNAGLVPLSMLLSGEAGATAPVAPFEGEKAAPRAPAAVPLPAARAARAALAVKRIDRVRLAAQRDAARAIRGALLDFRNDVLDRLTELEETGPRGARATVPDPDSLLAGLKAFVESLHSAMTPVFEDAVMAAAGTVEAELGRDLVIVTLQHPQIQSFVGRMQNRISSVPIDVATRIRDQVVESINANETYDDLRKRLKTAFNLETKHAATIAQQEAGEAVNGGRFETMALEGVTKHSWSAQLDGATRPSHVAVDGEVVTIGTKFSNGLLFPNDPAAPAEEVVNCRCVALAED